MDGLRGFFSLFLCSLGVFFLFWVCSSSFPSYLPHHLVLRQEVRAGQVVRVRAGRMPGAAIDVEAVAVGLDKAVVAPRHAPPGRDRLDSRRRRRLQGAVPLRLHLGARGRGQPLALLAGPDVRLVQPLGGREGGGRGRRPPQALAQALLLDVGAGRVRLGLLVRGERSGGAGLVGGGGGRSRGRGRGVGGQGGEEGEGEEGGGLEKEGEGWLLSKMRRGRAPPPRRAHTPPFCLSPPHTHPGLTARRTVHQHVGRAVHGCQTLCACRGRKRETLEAEKKEKRKSHVACTRTPWGQGLASAPFLSTRKSMRIRTA